MANGEISVSKEDSKDKTSRKAFKIQQVQGMKVPITTGVDFTCEPISVLVLLAQKFLRGVTIYSDEGPSPHCNDVRIQRGVIFAWFLSLYRALIGILIHQNVGPVCM